MNLFKNEAASVLRAWSVLKCLAPALRTMLVAFSLIGSIGVYAATPKVLRLVPAFCDGVMGPESEAHEPRSRDPRQELNRLRAHIGRSLVEMDTLTDRLLVALLVGGHVLIEGPPGAGKTKLAKLLAQGLSGASNRLQFTPDLMPSDVTGTSTHDSRSGTDRFHTGPIFTNIFLADEINRASPKTQSGLLEAMAEGQVSVSGQTHTLPDVFLVVATQNPATDHGTYPLPSAQMDRFIFKLIAEPHTRDATLAILNMHLDGEGQNSESKFEPVDLDVLRQSRSHVQQVIMPQEVRTHIVNLVLALNNPTSIDSKFTGWVKAPLGTRGSISLAHATRAQAWLSGRNTATIADVNTLAADVLRHRLVLSDMAEAEGATPDSFIKAIIEKLTAQAR